MSNTKIDAAIDRASAAALAADNAIQALTAALWALADAADGVKLSAADAAAVAWAPELVGNLQSLLDDAKRKANLCRIHAA